MIRQGRKLVLSFAALATLALGAGALAQAGQTTPKPARAAASQTAPEPAEDTSGPDRDNVQSGDQTTPDKPANGEKPDASAASGKKPESGGESSGETGSEVPENDGPGGHADEPDNPNADHQFSGQE